jgi:aspartyl-tRNA(Asn)/glutamyl-tRNA(Gln) amidotransferase subunit A
MVEERNRDVNALVSFRGDGGPAGSSDDGPLTGLPFAVKDNIAVRGFPLSCASNILSGLVSPYTATAVHKLVEAGAYVVGKTNMDEFGMGSSTENSIYGATRNPWDLERVAGGSSGGSAAAVAAGLVPFALGSDTGGSIRQPAAFCGVYGLKPTYGSVSRYGLVAYASSLEVIGVVSRSVGVARNVYRTMRGQDEYDHSSLAVPAGADEDNAAKRIGYLSGSLGVDPAIQDAYDETVRSLPGMGYESVPVQFELLDYVVPSYYTIATAEASANLARFNGVRYGARPEYAENPDDLVRTARSEGFGDEVKLRILLGTYVLRSGFQDQYYVRAQKVRTAIRADLDRIFTQVDALLTPSYPRLSFLLGDDGMDPYQQKLADLYTATANLTGVPAMTVPVAVADGLPVGLQIITPAFREERLFSIASRFEERYPVSQPPKFPGKWS